MSAAAAATGAAALGASTSTGTNDKNNNSNSSKNGYADDLCAGDSAPSGANAEQDRITPKQVSSATAAPVPVIGSDSNEEVSTDNMAAGASGDSSGAGVAREPLIDKGGQVDDSHTVIQCDSSDPQQQQQQVSRLSDNSSAAKTKKHSTSVAINQAKTAPATAAVPANDPQAAKTTASTSTTTTAAGTLLLTSLQPAQQSSNDNNNNNNNKYQQQHHSDSDRLQGVGGPSENNISNNYNNHLRNSNHLYTIGPATTTTTTKRQHRLSFLQSLLLRKWPYLALAILIMSSLMFAIILSATTVYLMHGSVDCGSLALAAAAAGSAASPHELVLGSSMPAAHLRPPPPHSDFESPIEQASGIGAGSGTIGMAALAPGDAVQVSASRLMYTNGGATSNTSSASGDNKQPVHSFERLPRSIWPDHYDLFIWPHIADPFNFSGKVSIQIRCQEASDNITLHSLELKIDEQSVRLDPLPQATASAGNGNVPRVTGLSQDKQLQHSIIKLDSKLSPGQSYVLSMDFSGTLSDDLNGFYKIKYERQNSTEISWIAATQFQATDARRAFPCFDEPIYKATFSIKIKHWKNMTALSNMPIINSEDSANGLWVTDSFDKSRRMSTYLVAYAVTNFKSRGEGNISVWTRPGLTHTAEYALKVAGKILRYYEEFFGIEYPLPKMDMIALPDFNAGAMENWGLITYRESSMLYDGTSSSVANKQRVAIVVAHELAHQWFGNLVTPKWWDDLWLNEGFASFVEYIGVDHVEPGWKMLDQFVIEEVQHVFRLDGLSSSHQISIPVNNPDEISEIFDHISYSKGASIIRMMLHFLTKDVFQLGLQRYLRSLKYSNAEQSDLWAYLTEAQRAISKQSISSSTSSLSQRANGYDVSKVGEVDVERVMNTWTLQTGYPVVTLTRSYDGSHKATLEQLRFQPYKSPQSNSTTALAANPPTPLSSNKQAQKWEIPITYTWRSEQNWNPITRLWMHQNDSSPARLDPNQMPQSDDEWILLNVDQVGYYRVNYDRRNWQLLIDQLNEDHNKIKTTNRAQLLDDIFELAKTGDVEYKLALEATRYLRKEREYLPWETALGSFSYIDEMLKRTPLYGEWQDFLRDLTAPYYARYKHLEWTMDADNATMFGTNDVLEESNQVHAIIWACQLDNHCINRAKKTFNDWKRTGINRINPSLRYVCYCTAIENGDRDDWDFLWKRYEKEQSANERDRILRSLGCSKEGWILARYLEWIFDKTKPIRRQDGAYVFRMIAANNNGRDIAFNFMQERWQSIREYYGKTSFSMASLIRSIATSMNTQTELNQLMAFYESVKHDAGTGKRSFQIVIEEVEGNINWKNRNYKILENWIRSELKNSTSSSSP